MKRMLGFAAFFAVFALSLAAASCISAPINGQKSPAYSDKAENGLRSERDPAVKKQEKPAESAPHKDNHTGHHANGGHHDHGGHHNHGMACAANLERGKAGYSRPYIAAVGHR